MSQKIARTPVVADVKEGAREKERSKTPTKKKISQVQQNIIDNKPTVKIITMDIKENANGQAKEKDEPKDTLPQENNQGKEAKPKENVKKQNGDHVVSNNSADLLKTNEKVDKRGTNGTTENGTPNNGVKSKGTAEEEEVVTMEQENDEMFPELRYEEASDSEGNFESSTPDSAAAGRSLTRRSQVKSTRTPETPKPVGNGKAATAQPEVIPEEKELKVSSEGDSAEPNDASVTADDSAIKILKLKDGPLVGSPMKLRSSDSPVQQLEEADKAENKEVAGEQNNDSTAKEDAGMHAKCDTNFSKSRIKVSPYRRSMRKNDQQNTTPGIESAEPSTSQIEEVPSTNDDSLSENQDRSSIDFRTIKGRRSYKQLREVSLRNLSMQRHRREAAKEKEDMDASNVDSVNATTGSDIGSVSSLESSTISSVLKNRFTPIGTVIGRKRRPSPSPERQDVTVEAYLESVTSELMPAAKRIRFFDRMSERVSAGVTPIRRFLRRGYTVTNSTPVEVSLPEEYRDVGEVEYMSIVAPSEPSPLVDDPPVQEPLAEKMESVTVEIDMQAVPALETATVQPNRRCSIM